jgi:hypothetical protein
MSQPKREPLKVGDRVRAYDVCRETTLLTSDTGTIRDIRVGDGALFIDFDHWRVILGDVVHPRQVRRLRPRQRREFWLELNGNGAPVAFWPASERPAPVPRFDHEYVHVREVRSGRKTGGDNA